MLFKGNGNGRVNFNFNNLEVKVVKTKTDNGETETVNVNGNVNVDYTGNENLIVNIRESFGFFIERVIDRFCRRDENVAREQNHK